MAITAWRDIAMELKNLTEDVVIELYDEIISGQAGICSCDRCRHDTIALALSHLKARYAGSGEGEVLVRLQLSDSQVRADVMMALLSASRTVQGRPHRRGI
ncbi:MAG TPA: competence protein ComFB [Firmicutes bacterium]|nr:competence protein ComFB [Bacillota bacterium]